jgi:hypothetical protein
VRNQERWTNKKVAEFNASIKTQRHSRAINATDGKQQLIARRGAVTLAGYEKDPASLEIPARSKSAG